MTESASVDYFSDPSLIPDPYSYFDHLRASGPVQRATSQNVLAVTGHTEAVAAYKDPAMSSCVAVAGPFPPLPFTPQGEDITAQIEQHRAQIPMAEHVVTMDGEQHTRTRGLLNKLLTPKRLSENEEFMWALADRQLDTSVGRGRCEFLEEYAKPFATLVVADLLGVPAEDHPQFRAVLSGEPLGGLGDEETVAHNPLVWLDEKFAGYINDRRAQPQFDTLTELAQARYPDGSTPLVDEVVKLATFLFAAGQDTTTKLLSAAIRIIAERPDIQDKLRSNRELIPGFVEETLRLESPVKTHFRLAGTNTRLGDTAVPAGAIVMLLPGASNRDPRKFDEPNEFHLDRKNVREHVAFGRGPHSCLGAPLARTEGRITMNRVLDRMANVRISEQHHGPEGNRHYDYEPTFIMRGLTSIHVDFDPVEG